MPTDNKKKLGAYEILFSYTIAQPGSITIPGYDEEDAKQRLAAFLERAGGYKDLIISDVVNIEDTTTFKQMIAQHALSFEMEQKYFEQWLDRAGSTDEAAAAKTIDGDVVDTPKVLN